MNTLFDQAAMPARDEYGFAFHPDLDQFLIDADGNLSLENDSEDLRYSFVHMEAAGWESAVVDFEDDASAEVRDAYAAGDLIAGWNPTPPAGEHWQLVAISDTEDGPKAMYVRPKQ
jgi:hypothetical protein